MSRKNPQKRESTLFRDASVVAAIIGAIGIIVAAIIQRPSSSQTLPPSSTDTPTITSTNTLVVSSTETQTPALVIATPLASNAIVKVTAPQPTINLSATATSPVVPISTPVLENIISFAASKTPLKTANEGALGSVEIKLSEVCKESSRLGAFEIKVKDEVVSNSDGVMNNPINPVFLPAGSYDIVFHPSIGEPIVMSNVNVQSGTGTVVDLSDKLGSLTLKIYQKSKFSRFSEPTFLVYSGSNRVPDTITPLRVGEEFCMLSGNYSVRIPDGSVPNFPSSSVTINVEIKPNSRLIIEPENWMKELGVVSFNGNLGVSSNLEAEITNLQTGEKVQATYFLSSLYWTRVGTYKISISHPYVGLNFDLVEVRPGEETPLELPRPSTDMPTLTTDSTLSNTLSLTHTLFYEDFENESKPEWIISDNLALSDGKLASDKELRGNIGDTSWVNYRIMLEQVRIQDFSFLLRMQDDKNYMEMRCHTVNGGGLGTHDCSWYKVINGQEQETPGLFNRISLFDTNIEIEVYDQAYRLIINGKEESKYVDLQSSFERGGFAIISHQHLLLESLEAVSLT